ncbi:phage holin family protein [Phenylobacterium sp.]|uniref:phage holin family protein n=1 Tax=Phenylobacterium sp. TaxID=1871053 RepID=UPI00301CB0C1
MDGGQPPRAGIVDLVTQLVDDVSGLLRKEAQLIRTEVAEKVRSAGRAVTDIAAGGLLLIAALLILLQALVLALSKVMDPIWAALLVGLGVAGVGYLLVRSGMRAISPRNLSPDRSTRQLGKTAGLMTSGLRKDAQP